MIILSFGPDNNIRGHVKVFRLGCFSTRDKNRINFEPWIFSNRKKGKRFSERNQNPEHEDGTAATRITLKYMHYFHDKVFDTDKNCYLIFYSYRRLKKKKILRFHNWTERSMDRVKWRRMVWKSGFGLTSLMWPVSK